MDTHVRLDPDTLPLLDVEVMLSSVLPMRLANLVCITAYNEGAAAFASTLASLHSSLREARRDGLRSAGDCGLCLVVDGREKLSRDLLEFLLAAGLVTPAALQEYQRTRFFFSRRRARELPWPGERCDDDEDIGFVVFIKGRNRGKLHSHALFFGHLCARLQPRLCFQIDCGTTVAPRAVGAMLAQFEREPGTAALASCIATPTLTAADGLIEAWQFMDFATQAAVHWPAELKSGHLSVLPGQFSALRWRSLSANARAAYADEQALRLACAAGDDDPLGRYLRGLVAQRPLDRVTFLAEDRVIGNEILVGRQPWQLAYCAEARATTDACSTPLELLRKRRRWNNGSAACKLWLAGQWATFIRRPDHTPSAKLRFTTSLVRQALLVLQQCAAPATFVCFLMVVARGVDAALQRHAPEVPLALGLSLAVGLATVALRRPGAAWRDALRVVAFAAAYGCLALLLAETLPGASLAGLFLLPVAATLVTTRSVASKGAAVLRRAAEYQFVNPVMQIDLWAYSGARLPDTSWVYEGSHPGRRHPHQRERSIAGPVRGRERAAGRCGSHGAAAGAARARFGARVRAAHVRADALGRTAAAPHRCDASAHRQGRRPGRDRRSRPVNRDQEWGGVDLVALTARRRGAHGYDKARAA